jgi:hypothetical protein
MRNQSGENGTGRGIRAGVAVLGIVLLGIGGCQADREALPEGATLETPPQVDAAPAAPFPSEDVQPMQPRIGADTMPGSAMPADTLLRDTMPR